MSNFFSIPIVFSQFFTGTALGDTGLCFSLMLVRKTNAVERGNHLSCMMIPLTLSTHTRD